MKKRRPKNKYKLSEADNKLLEQMRVAADEGYLEPFVMRLMNNVMSDDIPTYRRSNDPDRLRRVVIRQLSIMANVVADEKGINLSFTPVHPGIIFSKD
jgi:hypothetical protein